MNTIVSVFMCKLLEDKPTDILSYAGEFFEKYPLTISNSSAKLKEIVAIEKQHFFG